MLEQIAGRVVRVARGHRGGPCISRYERGIPRSEKSTVTMCVASGEREKKSQNASGSLRFDCGWRLWVCTMSGNLKP